VRTVLYPERSWLYVHCTVAGRHGADGQWRRAKMQQLRCTDVSILARTHIRRRPRVRLRVCTGHQHLSRSTILYNTNASVMCVWYDRRRHVLTDFSRQICANRGVEWGRMGKSAQKIYHHHVCGRLLDNNAPTVGIYALRISIICFKSE
jgi:hypothetical protein